MSGEGFLARWSRRKTGPDRDLPAPTEPALPALIEPTTPEQPFDPASLPPLDSLTAGCDITAFLAKGVPAALKAAALSRAWRLNPAIRDYVGPADYAWDWNAPGGVPGLFTPETGGLEEAIKLADRLLAPEPPGQSAVTPAMAAPPRAAPPSPPPMPTLAPLPTAEPTVPPRRHGAALPRLEPDQP